MSRKQIYCWIVVILIAAQIALLLLPVVRRVLC